MKLGISFKIAFGVSGALILIILLMGLYEYHIEKTDVINSIQAETDKTLAIITTGARTNMNEGNPGAIQLFINSLIASQDKMLLFVRVYNDKKQLMAEALNETLLHLYDNKHFHDEYLKKENRVVYNKDKEIGSVEVFLSLENAIESFQERTFRILIKSCFLLSILFPLIIFWMKYWLDRPLKKLVNGLKSMQENNYKLLNAIDFKDELADLAETYNIAAKAIEERDRRLHEQNEHLEYMVMKRTEELNIQTTKSIANARLAALGEMSSGVAHEINTPLAVIGGNVNMIRKNFNGQEKPEIKKSLDKIEYTVNKIIKIVKNLKVFARDGSKDPMTAFSLKHAMEELYEYVKEKSMDLGIDIEISLPEGSLLAWGREVQISQVLVNLVSNSMDAITNFDEKWIKIEVRDQMEQWEISVEDSGLGILPELQTKIMEPFFTTKEVGKGTGLGLSISLGIIRDHGGDLYIDNQCEHTRFVFSLKKALEKRRELEEAG